ncbi:MAG: hypothetical protein ABWJ42_03875 [Sulfolobales archaeon]
MYSGASEFLELSYYLAFLNYVLGALLLGSPLPFAALKRFGVSLMKDSVAGFILITSFWIILSLVGFIQRIVGADPKDLEMWFTVQFISISQKLALLRILILSSNPILRSIIDPIVSAASSILTTAFTSLIILRLLYSLVSQKGGVLIALGILLYNLPLGVFKRAGSLLISFIVISLIALPAMPNFISLLYTNLGYSDNTQTYYQNVELVAYPKIYVRDYSNESLSYAYVKFYSENSDEMIAAYQADRNGVIDTRNIGSGLPVNKRVTVSLELYGWSLTSLSNIELSDNCLYTQCEIFVRTPNIIVSESPYILVHNTRYLVEYSYEKNLRAGEGYIKLYLYTTARDELIITLPYTTRIVSITLNNLSVDTYDVYAWEWNGVSGYSYKIPLEESLNIVEIHYTYSEPPIPRAENKLYNSQQLNQETLENLLSNIIVAFIVSTVFPAIYLTLIIMASNALSRVLSSGRI